MAKTNYFSLATSVVCCQLEKAVTNCSDRFLIFSGLTEVSLMDGA
jgi:hypothetical protein